MIEWSEEHWMLQQAVRQFVDEEIRPHVRDLEHGTLTPYGIIRRLFDAFGMADMARADFERRVARDRGEPTPEADSAAGAMEASLAAALTMIPVIEVCRVCPGITTAMGVSLSLAAGTIMSRGTVAQKERWALPLLTFETIGAWAITEPDAGSDALGGMQTTVRPDEDNLILNGSKTFITNGPHADTIVVYAKLDHNDGTPPREREVVTMVLDSGMEGLGQTPALRKMGTHSSPTGELFFSDVVVTPDRVLSATGSRGGSGRANVKSSFVIERAGVAAMALGVIEECLALSIDYARNRTLWGTPIAEFQQTQLKLARMEVARLNVQNLVFRHIEMTAAGRTPMLAEASAMKLYSAQAAHAVADDAVQLFGGNGYMAEYRVEQLARDARAFRIYAGTDEIQVTHIARDLLSR